MQLKETDVTEALLTYLKEKPLINANILGSIENDKGMTIYTDHPEQPTGVYAVKGYMRHVYSENQAFLDAVVDMLNAKSAFYGFSGVHEPIAMYIMEKLGCHWRNKCSIWSLDIPIDPARIQNNPKPLEPDHATLVNAHYEYAGPGSEKRIRNDIAERPSSAIYIDGKPVCWVLVHDDNSMGIMYTLEEHRRKGYAIDVTLDLYRQLQALNKPAFIQIVEGNTKSEGLAQKCGFTLKDYCYWFGVMTGMPEIMFKIAEKAQKELNDCPWPSKNMPPYYRFNNRGFDHEDIYTVLRGQEAYDTFGTSGFVEMELLEQILKKDWEVWVTLESGELRAVALTKHVENDDSIFEPLTPVIPGRTEPWRAMLEQVFEDAGYFMLYGFGVHLEALDFKPIA